VRSARKHLLWYLRSLGGSAVAQQRLRDAVLTAETCAAQLAAVQGFFDDFDLPLAA